MFVGGDLYPFEFCREPTHCPPAEFVREYAQLLSKHNLEDLLGFISIGPGEGDRMGWETTDFEKGESVVMDSAPEGLKPENFGPSSWIFFQ